VCNIFVLYDFTWILYLRNLDYDMCSENREEMNAKFKDFYWGGGAVGGGGI
jgi:hypothetical protein